MNKEDILRLSREENEGTFDERELVELGSASKVGMQIGLIICALLVVVSKFLLHVPELGLACWLVFFAMKGSTDLVLYHSLKYHKHLIWGLIEVLFAFIMLIAIVVITLV